MSTVARLLTVSPTTFLYLSSDAMVWLGGQPKTGWRVGLRGEWLMGHTLHRVILGLTGFTEKALGSPGRQHAACASGVCPGSKEG